MKGVSEVPALVQFIRRCDELLAQGLARKAEAEAKAAEEATKAAQEAEETETEETE